MRNTAADAGHIVRFTSQDGLRLAARIFDAAPSGRLPLLCLPGLSRNSRDFIALGEYASRHPSKPRKVLALDYRGRGLSDPDPNWRNYTPAVEAQDVMAAAAALGIERAVVVGTSRGGIIAMILGALRPGLLAGVVLNDIGPVVHAPGLARIKSYLSTKPVAATWEEAVAALRKNAAGQFPALDERDWRALAEAYFAPAGAGLSPQFDANLSRVAETIDAHNAPELWPQFASLGSIPVLAIRGAFSDILSPATLGAMAERHPGLEHWTVPGQGHAPLLRDPPTLQRILALAERCDSVRPN